MFRCSQYPAEKEICFPPLTALEVKKLPLNDIQEEHDFPGSDHAETACGKRAPSGVFPPTGPAWPLWPSASLPVQLLAHLQSAKAMASLNPRQSYITDGIMALCLLASTRQTNTLDFGPGISAG